MKAQTGSNFLEQVAEVIKQHCGNESFDVAQLSETLGLSRTQLYRKLRAEHQPAPSALLRTARLRRARDLLAQTDLAITEVAYRSGFRSTAYFAQCFREDFGMTPSQFRRRSE